MVDDQVVVIGDYWSRVDSAIKALDEQGFGRRFWEKDASLWKQGPDGEKVIAKRLGWLDAATNIAASLLANFPDLVQSHLDNGCHTCQSGAFTADRPYQVEAL